MPDSASGPTGNASIPWAKQQQCKEAQGSGPEKLLPQKEKRGGHYSTLLLPERGERSLMRFFQEQFRGYFKSSVTEEAQGDLTVPAPVEREFPLHLEKYWQFQFRDK